MDDKNLDFDNLVPVIGETSEPVEAEGKEPQEPAKEVEPSSEEGNKEPQEPQEPQELEGEPEGEPEGEEGTPQEPVYGEEADEVAVGAYKTLVDRGIIEDNEEFDGSFEALEDQLSTLPQRTLAYLIENAPDPVRDLIEFGFSSDNITNEDLVEYFDAYRQETSEEQELSSFEKTDDARTYLENLYQERGMKPTVAKAAVDALEDEQEDGKAVLEEANNEVEKHNSSVKEKAKEKRKQLEEQKQQEAKQKEQFAKQLQETVKKSDWSTKRKQLVINQLASGDTQRKIKSMGQNPDTLLQLANFASYYNEEDNTFNFDDFANQVGTKQAKKIRSSIMKDAMSSQKTKGTKKDPNKSILDDFEPVDPIK